jgi:hypothetical protein
MAMMVLLGVLHFSRMLSDCSELRRPTAAAAAGGA